MQADASFLQKEEKRLTQLKAETDARREARALPAAAEHPKLVEFLLNTTNEEMDFELVRCRPLLVRPPAAPCGRFLRAGRFSRARAKP